MTALTMALIGAALWLASGFVFLSLCRVASRADARIENEHREWQLVQAGAKLHRLHHPHPSPNNQTQV